MNRVLYWIDFVTSLVFFIESAVKIMTYGFVFCGEFSYMRNAWNAMDFFIMILSVVSISPFASKISYFKMFRIVRVLRLIGKDEGLKIGLQALLRAIPNVLRITGIMLLFFLIFGIISVSFFKGTFRMCQNSGPQGSITGYNDIFIVESKWDCLNTGGDWQNKYYNFDNILFAMVTLFIMCNISGWQEYMYIACQTTQVDYVWKKWTNPYWVFFFIAFMVVGAFFLLNLFVGVVISSFNREKDLLGGNTLLTEK